MTRHSIKLAFTHFVVIVSIAASIGVGSVEIGGTAEVAAMPIDCDRLLFMAGRYQTVGNYFLGLGYVNIAYHYFVMAQNYDAEWAGRC